MEKKASHGEGTSMCVEKKRLEMLCQDADDRYRQTVAALDRQGDAGSVRRAIRVANQAWSAHSEACQALNEHLVDHGCGPPQPVRRPRRSDRDLPFEQR